MDEPTSGVDVSTRHDVLHLLADLHEDGVAIVLTTHDLNGMAAHLPHLVCVHHRIVADGTPRELESRSRWHNAVSLILPSTSVILLVSSTPMPRLMR